MSSFKLNDNGSLIGYNPMTSNVPYPSMPKISSKNFLGPNSVLIGDITIHGPVFIGFNNVIRADLGSPFFIGHRTSIQNFCLIHGLPKQYINVDGHQWSVYIDGHVNILHSTSIHGPCRIGKNTFIGQHVSIFDAIIEPNCVILHGANISGGITIPEGRFVEPGKIIFRQEDADCLPNVPSEYLSLNSETLYGYMELLDEYLKQTSYGQIHR